MGVAPKHPKLDHFSIKAYALGDPRELRTPHVRILTNLYSSKKWEYFASSQGISAANLPVFWDWEMGMRKTKKTDQPHLFLDRVHPTFWGHYPGLTPPKPITTSPSDMQVRCDAMLCRFQLLVHFFIEFGVLLSFCQILELGLFFMIICDCSALKLLLWGLLSCWCELPFASGLRSRRLGTGKLHLHQSEQPLPISMLQPGFVQHISTYPELDTWMRLYSLLITLHQIHRNSIGMWIHNNPYIIYQHLCHIHVYVIDKFYPY